MKKTFYIFTIAVLLISCNNSKQETKIQGQNSEKVIETEQLIGSNGKITFPEMTAEVKYINDSTLHWKTTDSKGLLQKVTKEWITKNLQTIYTS